MNYILIIGFLAMLLHTTLPIAILSNDKDLIHIIIELAAILISVLAFIV